VSLLTAVLTAMVLAIFGFPFRYYQCWLSWSRIGARVGILTYLIIAGCGGGLIGWLAAAVSEAKISSTAYIDGIFYGVAGTLAVRADFRLQKRSLLPNPGHAREAASLLGKGIEWTTNALDDLTRTRAMRWLKELDDESLVSITYEVIHDIEDMPAKDMPARVKKATLGKVSDAFDVIQDQNRRHEARTRIEDFCADFYLAQHSVKPALRGRARAQ
jgi:hypothetical protein